jgi:hypothetical protein
MIRIRAELKDNADSVNALRSTCRKGFRACRLKNFV